jgi:hypothetical protein
LPLLVSPTNERILLVRLDCARQVYSACLGEALRRLARMHASAAYRTARARPRGKKNFPTAAARTAAFKVVNAQ